MTCHPKFAYHTEPSLEMAAGRREERSERLLVHANLDEQKDANDRGIKYGDLVRVFNQRGQILCWAQVSEMMMPGVARVNYGRWNDYVEPTTPGSLDKSGNSENIATGGFISPYDNQQDVQAVAQVEKWTGAV